MKNIAEIIKAAREANGFTQTVMASKLGIGLRQYQNIEAGLFPKYKKAQIEALEKVLGINISASIYEGKAAESVAGAEENQPIYEKIKPDKEIDFLKKRIEDLEKIISLQEKIIETKKDDNSKNGSPSPQLKTIKPQK